MADVYLCGRGVFAALVAAQLEDDGHRIVAVSSPKWRNPDAPDFADGELPDRLRAQYPDLWHPDPRPTDADVLVAAHSHRFVSKRVRSAAAVAVGYHPSLLPLHRGRDAIRWALRDGDRVVGGTVYHLTEAVDGGPIAAQDYLITPKGQTPESLWRDHLAPMGVRLLAKVVADVDDGRVGYSPQDDSLATWEPSWQRPRLHRPDLFAIEPPSPSIRYYDAVGGRHG